jgi:hypothetical protein
MKNLNFEVPYWKSCNNAQICTDVKFKGYLYFKADDTLLPPHSRFYIFFLTKHESNSMSYVRIIKMYFLEFLLKQKFLFTKIRAGGLAL